MTEYERKIGELGSDLEAMQPNMKVESAFSTRQNSGFSDAMDIRAMLGLVEYL